LKEIFNNWFIYIFFFSDWTEIFRSKVSWSLWLLSYFKIWFIFWCWCHPLSFGEYIYEWLFIFFFFCILFSLMFKPQKKSILIILNGILVKMKEELIIEMIMKNLPRKAIVIKIKLKPSFFLIINLIFVFLYHFFKFLF